MAQRAEPARLAAVVEACTQVEDRLALNPNPKFALLTYLVDAGVLLRR